MNHDNCPHCNVSLQGEPVPERDREAFGITHFRREIGIEVMGCYDGVLFYQCPDCNGRWHRWPVGTWQYAQAEKVWARWDEGPQ